MSQKIPPVASEPPERGLVRPSARLFRYLEAKDDILLVTTSNRYEKHTWDMAKTTEFALRVKARLEKAAKRVTLLDVTKLKIYTCEGEHQRRNVK